MKCTEVYFSPLSRKLALPFTDALQEVQAPRFLVHRLPWLQSGLQSKQRSPFTQSSKEEKEAPREGSFPAPQFASASWEGRRCLLVCLSLSCSLPQLRSSHCLSLRSCPHQAAAFAAGIPGHPGGSRGQEDSLPKHSILSDG